MHRSIIRIGLVIAGACLASACGKGDGSGLFGNGGNGGGGVQPRTVSEIVNQQISQSTNETAASIELNDLPIDDSDATETGTPNAL